MTIICVWVKYSCEPLWRHTQDLLHITHYSTEYLCRTIRFIDYFCRNGLCVPACDPPLWLKRCGFTAFLSPSHSSLPPSPLFMSLSLPPFLSPWFLSLCFPTALGWDLIRMTLWQCRLQLRPMSSMGRWQSGHPHKRVWSCVYWLIIYERVERREGGGEVFMRTNQRAEKTDN